MFDEGHLTDSHGRKVDFRNTIVVMTSNMGTPVIADLPSHLLGTEPQVQESIMDVVRSTLSPELLNRIDDVVIFNRLQRENMTTIAEIGVQEVATRLKEGQNMTLEVSPLALDCIAERGFDVRYGARPLKRVVAQDLLNPLSRMALEGGVQEEDVVRVKTRGEAEKLMADPTADSLGFVSRSNHSHDKNDIVVMRNHQRKKDQDEDDEDDQLLLEK
mmetsp:Transcript_34073/g.78587  ORF Transcript_34073/g.78587 Transcript_34073/m.78587 type:complete len:216 (+) Transcript_34073:1329-1976(+)